MFARRRRVRLLDVNRKNGEGGLRVPFWLIGFRIVKNIFRFKNAVLRICVLSTITQKGITWAIHLRTEIKICEKTIYVLLEL